MSHMVWEHSAPTSHTEDTGAHRSIDAVAGPEYSRDEHEGVTSSPANGLAPWSIPDIRILMRDGCPLVVEILSLLITPVADKASPAGHLDKLHEITSNHQATRYTSTLLEQIQVMIELVLFSGLESGSIHDPSLGDIWIEFKQSVWTHQSKYTFVDRLSGATVGPALKMQFLIQNKGIGCDMPCGHLDIPPNYHTVSESGVGHWPMSLPRTINAKSQASMDARHEIRFDPCGRHHLHSHIDCTTMDPTYSQILPAPTNEAIPPTHPLPINHRPCKRYRPRLRVIRRKKVLLTSYEKQVLVDSINSALGLKQGATTYDISGYPQLPRSITFRSFP